MSASGYSGTPLPRKLGIRSGERLGTYGAPDHLPGLLGELPAGVVVEAEPASGLLGVLLVFCRSAADLRVLLPPARDRLHPDGGLWVAWPKRSSPLAGDLREGDVRSAGLDAGLVDNKICAIDDDWSGLRLVYRVEDRPGVRRRLGLV